MFEALNFQSITTVCVAFNSCTGEESSFGVWGALVSTCCWFSCGGFQVALSTSKKTLSCNQNCKLFITAGMMIMTMIRRRVGVWKGSKNTEAKEYNWNRKALINNNMANLLTVTTTIHKRSCFKYCFQ